MKTYLLGIARMVLLEEHSRPCKHLTNQNDWLLENGLLRQEGLHLSLSRLERAESLLVLHNALSRLNRSQRLALRLYYFEGKSVNEAARLLKCTSEAFKSCLRRGRGKLRKVLRQMGV